MNETNEKRLDFTFLSLWLILSLGIAAFAWLSGGIDFRGYYAASRVFLAGGNPYNYQLVAQVLLETTGRMGNNPFYYLPWFLLFVIPFSGFPFTAARLIWLITNAFLWIGSLNILWNYLKISWPPWKKFLLWIFLNFTFLWITLKYEQTGVLLLFITVLIIHYLSKRYDYLVGLLLTFLLIKPTISFLIVIVLLVWCINNRRLGILFGFAISFGLLLIGFSILIPKWYMSFLEPRFGQGLWFVLDGPNAVVSTRINTTLMAWLSHFGMPTGYIYGIYAMIGVIGLWILTVSFKNSRGITGIISIAVLLTFWVTPYALQYDFPLLIIPFLYAFRGLGKRYIARRIGVYFLLMLMGSVLIWERPISDGFWLVLFTSILFFLDGNLKFYNRLA